MIETLQPILPKTPIFGLRFNVAHSGLCIGDTAELFLTESGDVVVRGHIYRRFLGVLPIRRAQWLGSLGPVVARILGPALANGQALRVRIVGITPEHLSGPQGPEVHVSVWGDPAGLNRAS